MPIARGERRVDGDRARSRFAPRRGQGAPGRGGEGDPGSARIGGVPARLVPERTRIVVAATTEVYFLVYIPKTRCI